MQIKKKHHNYEKESYLNNISSIVSKSKDSERTRNLIPKINELVLQIKAVTKKNESKIGVVKHSH